MSRSQRSSSTSTSSSDSKCGGCGKVVSNNEMGIQCEICDVWFHPKCQDINEDCYKAIMNLQSVHWYCKSCDSKVGKLLVAVLKLQNRVDLMGETMSKMREELSSYRDQVNEQAVELETMKKCMIDLNEEIKNKPDQVTMAQDSYAKIAEKVFDDKIGLNDVQLQEMQRKVSETKDLYKEEQDKEARRNNIIIYKVSESEGTNFEERKVDDKRFALQLFSKMQAGVDEDDVKGVVRLGKWAVSGNARPADAEPRPLLIQLSSRTAKSLIMENLYKLKHLEAKFKNVIISHDMTRKEREECKELVEEAKRKSEQALGDFIYRVRGYPGSMKIVQIRRY